MTIDQLAENITRKLFTNGNNEFAQRLVLEMAGMRDGGGYCREAVVSLIANEIYQESRTNLLGLLAEEIREINAANGWNVFESHEWGDTYKVPAILALIHSEVSEALEAFRANDQINFAEEMADVVIRVLDCVGGLSGIDFDAVVRAKLEKNKTRGHRHGGKRI